MPNNLNGYSFAPKVVEDMGKQVFKLGAARIAINLLLEGYLASKLIAVSGLVNEFKAQGEVVSTKRINELMFGDKEPSSLDKSEAGTGEPNRPRAGHRSAR